MRLFHGFLTEMRADVIFIWEEKICLEREIR